MKQSHTCPKCQSRRLLVTSDFQVPSQESSDAVEPLPPFTFTFRVSGWRLTAGRFEAWTCASCGFTEWYAKDFEKMDLAQAAPEVRLIDAGAPPGAPYR